MDQLPLTCAQEAGLPPCRKELIEGCLSPLVSEVIQSGLQSSRDEAECWFTPYEWRIVEVKLHLASTPAVLFC